MVDFEGRAFEFVGEVGRHYNVISETNQQVRKPSPSDIILLHCFSVVAHDASRIHLPRLNL